MTPVWPEFLTAPALEEAQTERRLVLLTRPLFVLVDLLVQVAFARVER